MSLNSFLAAWNNADESILVHTSGSTGKPKPFFAEKKRMLASARITCNFFHLQPGNTALLCMSLDYIAGKMMVVRALERNLKLISVEPSNHPLKNVEEPIDFAAMVPSQVFCSLQDEVERERLFRIKNLLIGGGAISEELEYQLSTLTPHLSTLTPQLSPLIYSSYGMTETLSHIALRKLAGAGASQWYEPLEGVKVSADAENCLVIDAPALHKGTLVTNDIVEFHADGRRFRVKGRRDNVICSGGLKLQIEELEDLLRPHLPSPFCVTSLPHEKFGEVAVLLSEDAASNIQPIVQNLTHYIHHFFQVAAIPLTPTGKINRAEAKEIASLSICNFAP